MGVAPSGQAVRGAHAPVAMLRPTHETYSELQQAYGFFNERLFGGQLPACLITLQREKRTCGYFSAQRFASLDGQTTDEIAINPSYFAVVPLTEVMQTLVHEMVHLWQHHFGKPGRGRYHNAEWADKMEAIGLMPSSTGQPGGARTGDLMADYAIEGGAFLRACKDLFTEDFRISWFDRFPAREHIQAGQVSMAMHLAADVGGGAVPAQSAVVMASLATPMMETDTAEMSAPINKSNRQKYRCACGHQVWGKPGLKLRCMQCEEPFIDGG